MCFTRSTPYFFTRGLTMDYELCKYIEIKLAKIEYYNWSSRTDEEYERRKLQIHIQIAKAKKAYKQNPTPKNKSILLRKYEKLKYNISRTEYLIILEDINNFKRQYPEIPLKLWQPESFYILGEQLKQGENLQSAIYKTEHFKFLC